MKVKVTRTETVELRAVLVRDDGHLVALPRSHPLFISVPEFLDPKPGVSSRRGPGGPIGNNRCEE